MQKYSFYSLDQVNYYAFIAVMFNNRDFRTMQY